MNTKTAERKLGFGHKFFLKFEKTIVMFAKTSNLKKMFNGGGGGGGVCGPLPVPEMIGSQRRRSVHFDPMASTVLTVPGPEDEGMFKMSLLNLLTPNLWYQYQNVSLQQKHTKRVCVKCL